MKVVKRRPHPDDYNRASDYVHAVLQEIDPMRVSGGALTRWRLRRSYPRLGLRVARIATDAVREWDAHNRGNP